MSASAEEEILPAPPQPPSPLPDEPFFAPAIVDGIDGDILQPPAPLKPDSISTLFSSFSSRMSDAMKASRTAVSSVLPAAKATLPAILFFGDSITEYSTHASGDDAPGWNLRLQEVYAGKVDLFVRGFSGYNTRWACHIFPQVLEQCSGKARIGIVFIFFGANDAVIDSGRQHVPLHEYVANLTKLVTYVRGYRRVDPIQPVLVTPPPVKLVPDQNESPTRLPARTREYAAACVNVARELACPVVDVHSEMMGRLRAQWENEELLQQGLDTFLSDGLHLNADGNRLVAELFLDTFRKDLPDFSPDVVKRPFPKLEDIDATNPEASLGSSVLV